MSDIPKRLRGNKSWMVSLGYRDVAKLEEAAADELERQSNNAASLAQQVADLTAELANERAHQFRALHEPDTCNGSMGAGGYVPACVALRAELQREHEDHKQSTDDAAMYMRECERLTAERDALRGKP